MRSFLIILIVFLNGCISTLTHQVPNTTPKGESILGLSLSYYISGDRTVILFEDSSFIFSIAPAIYSRYGISDNSDIGFTFFGYPVFGSFYIDYKHQISKKHLSAISIANGIYLHGQDFLINPSIGISFGNEEAFLGFRLNYLYYRETRSQYRLYVEELYSTFVFGFIIKRDNIDIIPEFNLYYPSIYLPGIGGGTSIGFSFSISFDLWK